MRLTLPNSLLLAASLLFPALLGATEQSAKPNETLELAMQLQGDAQTATLRLKPTQVWSRDAKIEVHSKGGSREIPPPNDRYFSGTIVGEAGSRAVLRISANGDQLGLVSSNGGNWLIHRDGDHALHSVALHEKDLSQKAFGEHFDCDVLTPPADIGNFFASQPLDAKPPMSSTPASSANTKAAQYEARVAVETDHELFLELGANTTDATRYLADLFAFISGIYETEVDTSVTISYLSLWEDSADPWTQTGTSCALSEFGYYWNNNRSDIDRTIAHFISGKNMGGGVAWLGVLCGGEFSTGANCPGLPSSGNFGGAYGVSAGIRGSFNAADPKVVWDFTVIAHEIGHNFNSPHTHCYGGIGGNNQPVDNCYGGETRQGCFTGTGVLPDDSVSGSGTIMSYCHLLSGGMSNIAPTFGLGHPYGNAPGRVPSQMFSHVQARASNNPSCLAPQTVTPGFRLNVSNASQSACINAGTLEPVAIQTQTLGGFSGDISLSLDPASPAGISGSFVDNPVVAGNSTQLNLSIDAGATVGTVNFNVTGSGDGVDPKQSAISINLFDALASTPILSAPTDNATDLSLLPTLSWGSVDNADGYRVQIADNLGMSNPTSNDTSATQWQPSNDLSSDQEYYWRVRALSSCGDSSWSSVRRFTTGACANTLETSFESDLSNWLTTQDGNANHWSISTARESLGSQSVFSPAPGSISDRQLTSPRISLPANADIQLRFDSWMSIETSQEICWDGALLEIAVGDGAFQAIDEGLLTGRVYDGQLFGNYGNPAAGARAWCGSSNGFEVLGADLSSFAGQEVRLRWRVATDNSNAAEGWYIDNVRITSCGGDTQAGNFALNLRVEGRGQLVSDALALQCSGQCQFDRPAGETVTLQAQADAGFVFNAWLDECVGSGASCQLTMDQARSAGASFSANTGPIFSDRFQTP
jgi:hypothetical protein